MTKKLLVVLISAAIILLLDVASYFYFIKPSNYDITTPGGLTEVKSFIAVDNSKEYNGSFNTIFVYTYDHVSLCSKNLAEIVSYYDVDIENNTFNLSEEERFLSGTIQKNQSIESSLILAYNEAKKDDSAINLDYEYQGAIVYTKQRNQHQIEIGDIVTSIETGGTLITKDTLSEFVFAINNLAAGDTINLVRNGLELSISLESTPNYNNQDKFYLYHKYSIDFETVYPKFSLVGTTVYGPSGGFLQTLSVYSQITGIDLTKGYKIAGTGTISIDGNIGPIGGIEQKIVTAIKNNVDIFLCPEVHYEEALEVYNKTSGHEKMQLICIPDNKFSEAINILRGLNND